MRLDQSSVDIASLIDKVQRGEIDLQPDFQRGEVWPEAKKRRLIDTILRDWYVPAIHIVVNDDYDREEILDGQQRLRTIISFMKNEFTVDGRIDPEDPAISALHGLTYEALPTPVRSRFRRFSINTVRLRDYRPSEPGELFFRLNQLTALTAAEQRNALIGAPRNQIRDLAIEFERSLWGTSIGFSNARMNYDDTFSRLALTLEHRSLSAKISAVSLEKRYREGDPFSNEIVEDIHKALSIISEGVNYSGARVRLNKASLFSWLFFIVDNRLYEPEHRLEFIMFFEMFEIAKEYGTSFTDHLNVGSQSFMAHPINREVLSIFGDRSSSRVNDVTSVLLRDLCLNVAAYGTALAQVVAPRLEAADLNAVVKRLMVMPTDVADRTVAETVLAKRWDMARASR